MQPSKHDRQWYRDQAAGYMQRAGIVLTPEEIENIEVADFALDELDETGLEVVVYINTERVCAKEMVLLPHQTCPEHYHPDIDGYPGKEETFRCRWGKVYLYVSGDPTPNPAAAPPAGREAHYNVWHEVVLSPGQQYTLMPGTLHWFQADDEGAVISEFSTRSRDESDVFTDPEIQRVN